MAFHATWVALRRIAVRARSLAVTLARRGSWLLAAVFVHLFGRWQWQSPVWIRWSRAQGGRASRYVRARPLHGAVAAAVLVAAGAGYAWYASRPKPHYVTYSIV